MCLSKKVVGLGKFALNSVVRQPTVGHCTVGKTPIRKFGKMNGSECQKPKVDTDLSGLQLTYFTILAMFIAVNIFNITEITRENKDENKKEGAGKRKRPINRTLREI